ncbi:ABC transporter substrate-binding protein [Roseospira goensis]|uniref:Branched-chain amino acid transport system substrate-binding protein n=1 Tax=Roseospira goensis TaxID=391922 RepID=A0A7W6WKF0_9PROT|nr:ABC transporter substrate-binding protein [Roseospira goensis]MBB4285377.1 branched-chain amino acid transport system substrate-binding protein [Roseospira goensis]
MPSFRPARALLSAAVMATVLAAGGAAGAQTAGDRVLIGDVTTVTRIGDPARTYQTGRDLAAGFIAMAGGVMGSKPVEIVAIDPGGDPDAAARAVADLKDQGAALFIGGLVADTTLAAARAAGDTPFLAVDARLPAALVRDLPNLYQIGPSAEALGRALAAEAAQQGAVRWGVVALDDYFGRALAHAFWNELRAVRPEVELAMEHYVAPLSAEVDGALDALTARQPEALLVGLRDGDLLAFVRAAAAAGLLDGRPVMAPQVGTPEILAALGADLPDDWVVTGYPCCEVGGQPHRAFAEAYRAEAPVGSTPTLGALYGYTAVTAAATAIDTAWSVAPGTLADTLDGLELSTPVGPMRFAPGTHQASLPLWVGRTSGGRFVAAQAVDPAALSQPDRP